MTELADASLPEALRAPPKADCTATSKAPCGRRPWRSWQARTVPGCAAGVTAGPVTDLAGTIGRLVLASLMAARRLRISPRVAKRAMSRYNARGKVDRTTYKATIDIAILTTALTPGDEP